MYQSQSFTSSSPYQRILPSSSLAEASESIIKPSTPQAISQITQPPVLSFNSQHTLPASNVPNKSQDYLIEI
jgi:hypothetical protein